MSMDLERLPRSSAPGLSGWTYDHLRAATGASPTATSTLMNLLISGCLPDIPSLHASTLIALAKPGGRGVRAIAQARCGSPCKPLRDGRLPGRWSGPRPLAP
jgi:hypothetical protein